MSKINWILCDIDGTLLSYEDKNDPLAIRKETIEEIHNFIDKGNEFNLVSGREYKSMLTVLEKLGIENKSKYIVSFNGAIIYDIKSKKIISKKLIDEQIIEKVFLQHNEFNKQNIIHGLAFESLDGDVYIFSGKDSNLLTKELYELFDEKPFCTPLKEQPIKKGSEIVRAFFYFGFNCKNIRELYKQTKSKISNSNVSMATDESIEIASVNCSKGSGAKILTEIDAHLNLENSMAIGDELNDISMLEVAKISVTLKNAPEENLLASKFVIDEPPSRIVAAAIRKFT